MDIKSILPCRTACLQASQCEAHKSGTLVFNVPESMMSHAHLDAFLHAMHDKDANGLLGHVTDDVTLWSPIFAEPFRGKERLRAVLGVVLGAVDRFEVVEVMHGSAQSAVAFKLEAADITLDGMDLITFDPNGLIATLKVMWRPLSAIVAMQNRIAPLVGAPVMSLVTAAAAAAAAAA